MRRFQCVVLLCIACNTTRSEVPEAAEVQRVELLGTRTFPEGVAAHSVTRELFVGGLAQGEIQRVTSRGAEVFKRSHEDGLLDVIGLAVDATRDRLWVCSTSFADPTVAPALVVFDTRSGERLAILTLPSDGRPHFLNDVDVDADGNAYATDSLAPVIWTVRSDLATVQPFVEDAAFLVTPESFNLNGLAVTPDDRFIVASVPSLDPAGRGRLFRIEIATRSVSEVELDRTFAGADGLVLLDDRRMIASGGSPGLHRLDFDADYRTARITVLDAFEPELDFPTTAAIADGRLWVVNSQLDHHVVALFGDRGPPELPFEIVGLPVEAL
jgi:sugar lactone lactonase YvrE